MPVVTVTVWMSGDILMVTVLKAAFAQQQWSRCCWWRYAGTHCQRQRTQVSDSPDLKSSQANDDSESSNLNVTDSSETDSDGAVQLEG